MHWGGGTTPRGLGTGRATATCAMCRLADPTAQHHRQRQEGKRGSMKLERGTLLTTGPIAGASSLTSGAQVPGQSRTLPTPRALGACHGSAVVCGTSCILVVCMEGCGEKAGRQQHAASCKEVYESASDGKHQTPKGCPASRTCRCKNACAVMRYFRRVEEHGWN